MEVVYNLRNRIIIQSSNEFENPQSSFIDDIFNFGNKYKDFLTTEHISEISSLRYATYIESINDIFRLLTFAETMYSKSKNEKYYLKAIDETSIKDLFIMNETIFCLRMNYLNMKRDLYLLYKKHVDSKNVSVSSFLESYKFTKNRLTIDFDNAQLTLDTIL